MMESMCSPQETDQLARAQLAMFENICTEAGLTVEDQGRFLRLAPHTWQAWRRFRMNGPRPVVPTIRDMLLRIGTVSFELLIATENNIATA